MKKQYKEYVYVNDRIRIHNTKLTFKDFKKEDGWIDWAKLEAHKAYYILLITGISTGKSYGSANYLLTHGKNFGYIANTKDGSERAINALLRTLQKKSTPNPEFYEGWYVKDNGLWDTANVMRVKAAGLRAVGISKTNRDFYADDIIFDEFNQQHEQAEIKNQNPQQSLDTISNRWVDSQAETLKHIYMFANKDGDSTNILNTKFLFTLGIYALNEYSEIFEVEKEFMGEWNVETLVINPKFDEKARAKVLQTWAADPVKYRREISQYHSGTAEYAYFNDDTSSWLLDGINYDYMKSGVNKPRSVWYLYQSPDIWIEINVFDPKTTEYHKRYFMRMIQGKIPKGRKYYIKFSGMESVKPIPPETLQVMLVAVNNNEIVYDTTATKIQFLTKNIL